MYTEEDSKNITSIITEDIEYSPVSHKGHIDVIRWFCQLYKNLKCNTQTKIPKVIRQNNLETTAVYVVYCWPKHYAVQKYT